MVGTRVLTGMILMTELVGALAVGADLSFRPVLPAAVSLGAPFSVYALRRVAGQAPE